MWDTRPTNAKPKGPLPAFPQDSHKTAQPRCPLFFPSQAKAGGALRSFSTVEPFSILSLRKTQFLIFGEVN